MVTMSQIQWIWAILCSLTLGVSGIKKYQSCSDVARDLAQNAVDGEYIMYLSNIGVAVPIYCQGFKTNQPPKSYITLPAGKSKNFAYYYENIGSNDTCADKYPKQQFQSRGRSEFGKIQLDLQTFNVDVSDFSFANQTGFKQISYATAGDYFTSSTACQPMGAFQVDLEGTPFSISKDITWTSSGNLANGASKGVTQITNSSYLGCWQDKTDRLLPAGRLNSQTQTIDKCRQHCRYLGFPYAGVEYSVECHCGNNYDRYGSAPDSQCNKRCAGNPAQTCGGTWKMSVFSTASSQKFVGRCGGFPAHCFPAKKSNPQIMKLTLELMPDHICLTKKPCQNEGMCVAVSGSDYNCVCYDGYSGKNCDIVRETIFEDSSMCPVGYQAETCFCAEKNCNGAKFEGDNCVTASGSHPQVVCRPGNPGHVILFNRNGINQVSCPAGASIVGCSFWSTQAEGQNAKGQGHVNTGVNPQVCQGWNCRNCEVHVRCKQFVCGCKNGAHCNTVTGQCECPPGYYGTKCETFDFCSYYEDHNNATACGKGGICSAIPKKVVKAFGGDRVSDTCVFPYEFQGITYSSCIEENYAGPPFACAAVFDKSTSYIDLGKWSPGPTYTLAAWVKPDIIDTIRRTVAGGVSECNDFGININSGYFRGFLKVSQECTIDIYDPDLPMVMAGQWYMVAITNNGSHSIFYQNGVQIQINTVLLNNIPTSSGFRIGGEVCCPNEHFTGMIKTVKVWNRALSKDEINRSMYNIGTSNSSQEALYGGLVGHWELAAEPPLPQCLGNDHGGGDWTLIDGVHIWGVHCNISKFKVPRGVTASITAWDGTSGGILDISAKDILIEGFLDGTGAGYRGGNSSSTAGDRGLQGESYIGVGGSIIQANRGGGGAGNGGSAVPSGGRAGGGAGYGMMGSDGKDGVGTFQGTGSGAGGATYGDHSRLYMGSGGGSGGNARDLTTSPKGGRGGSGGAGIRLTAQRSVIISGTVSAKGGDGEGDTPSPSGCILCPDACDIKTVSQCSSKSASACWDMSGPGGGGSGGSIFITAKLVDIGLRNLWVMGGKGGLGAGQKCGGTGGAGMITTNSVILKGSTGIENQKRVVVHTQLSDKFMDYSQDGQKLIDYTTTVYGNEVYLGCFIEQSTANTKLGHQVALTVAMRNSLTPKSCQQMCRKKNYQFSGTQAGNQCFCDNHFDATTDRARDSDCSTKCSGDPLRTCGGTFRIQVFGPPPSNPATGHNVVPKCQPWCVTADPFSDNPKWGECSTSMTISDWNVHCECPPGMVGQNCDEICSSWTWGRLCSKNCTCNTTTTASCNPNSGKCLCKPGYRGEDCSNTCPQGYFGQGCKIKCDCKNNTLCDPFTGKCLCKPGFMGKDCNFPCPAQKFGIGCNLTCNCYRGSCSPEDGSCECDPGYKLPFCYEICDPTNYGQDCEQYCDCNKQPCHPVTGVCQCGPGYIGHKCEIQCPHGTWGPQCKRKCSCQGDYGCDHVTGECICGPGFIGQRCDIACPHGSYGKDCLSQCPCKDNQTTLCDPVNGACTCKDGFKGSNCESPCDQGYYGAQCSKMCTCLHGSTCNSVNGTCTCPPGFIGKQCETPCPAGFAGKQCQTSCQTCSGPGGGVCNKATGVCMCQQPVDSDDTGMPCFCPRGYYGESCSSACSCVQGTCQGETGQCTCNAGWRGVNCDQPCVKGTYGLKCNSTCTCLYGSCDPITGVCSCNPGFTGSKCDTECKNGTYGPNCRFQCSPCGKHAFNACDRVSGQCLCSDGFTGPLCDRPCPAGKYGANCSKTCSCLNGGYCESVSGKCVCAAGYAGVRCQNKCAAGKWGLDCSRSCTCGPQGVGCTPDEGVCKCQPGFTGVKCRQSCVTGYYGSNCTERCQCSPVSSYCSPVDGSCQCKVGYSGKMCEAVCPTGKWGKGCSQDCRCNARGTCNPFNGQCDCAKGYTGTSCENQCQQDIFWGKNCAQKCNCSGERCDHRDGTCRCPPGRTGQHCQLTCDSRHFGFQCAQLCGCQNGGICDHVTGACRCQPGWSGEICTKNCPSGHYGADCAMTCKECFNDGLCDSFTGSCICATGFTGPQCNKTVTLAAVTPKPGESTAAPPGGTSYIKQTPATVAAVAGIHFTVGQLAGLIIGLLLLTVLVAIVVGLVTRLRYLGRFGGTQGAVKFQGDEVEINEMRSGNGTSTTFAQDSGDSSFVNPVHELEEANFDSKSSKSEISTATSGVASCMVDSDEEENYFKDSSA